MSDGINKKEESIKGEAKSNIRLSPEIEKLLDEWTNDPSSKVFVKLAEEYRKSCLLDEALNVCEEGLKHNPNYLSAKVVYAKILFDLKKYDQAFEEIKKVSTIQSDNLMAQNLLLKLFIQKGDKANAIKTCDIILYLDPKNEEVINKKKEILEHGIIHEIDDDMESKISDDNPNETSDESIDDDDLDTSSEGFATNTIAELYIKQGFYDKGLKIYKEMLIDSPHNEELIKKIKEIERMKNPNSVSIDELDDDAFDKAERVASKVEVTNDEKIGRLSKWLGIIKSKGVS